VIKWIHNTLVAVNSNFIHYLKAYEGMNEQYQFFPDEVREKLPTLYAGEELGLMALALVKFFTPDSNWTCAVRRRK